MFRSWGGTRVEVVPNGVDTAAVAYAPPGVQHELLYVGQYGYRPNEAAAVDLSVQLSSQGLCRAVRRVTGPVPGARLITA